MAGRLRRALSQLLTAGEPEVISVPPKPVLGLRSGSWPRVRKTHLQAFPACAVCGTKKDIDVHHIRPFHLFPGLELDYDNLMSLCTPHHFLFGHLCSWPCFNETVEVDANIWRCKILARGRKP